jgi:hypothetical protein
MIRPRSHKAGKAESLFGDILKPFFDSIDQKLRRLPPFTRLGSRLLRKWRE